MRIAGMVCGLGGIVLLCGLLVGGGLIRAAVAITNRVLGPARADPVDPIEDWDWDGDLDPVPLRRRAETRAIPVPRYGKAMGIAFLAALTTCGSFVVLGMLADYLDAGDMDNEWTVLALAAFAVPPGFAVLTLLFVAALPTTLARAALTAVVHHALGLFVLLAAAAAIALLAAFLG